MQVHQRLNKIHTIINYAKGGTHPFLRNKLLIMLFLLIPVNSFALGWLSQANGGCFSVRSSKTVYVANEPVELDCKCVSAKTDITIFDYWGEIKQEIRNCDSEKYTIEGLDIGWYTVKTKKHIHSFAIVPPMKSAGNGFGVDMGLGYIASEVNVPAYANLSALAGVRIVRERFQWSEVEKRRGKYNWENLDNVINEFSKKGIMVHEVFEDIPEWARNERNVHKPPDDLRIAFNLGKSFANQYKGKVSVLEVWNEQDLPGSWFKHSPGDQYAAFLKVVYLGVKAVKNSNISVSLAGLAHHPGKFVQLLMENDAQYYFDIYNYHYYSPHKNFETTLKAHSRALEKYSIMKPIIISEFGSTNLRTSGRFERDLSSEMEKEQVNFLVSEYVKALANGVTDAYYFIFRYFREKKNSKIKYGLFNEKIEPKPAYVAFTMLNNLIGGSEFIGNLATDINSYLFKQSDSKHVVVVWSHNKKKMKAVIKSSANDATLITVMGNQTKLGANNGSITVDIKDDPLFLVYDGEVNFTQIERPKEKQNNGALFFGKNPHPDNSPPAPFNRDIIVRALFPQETKSNRIPSVCRDKKKSECHIISEKSSTALFDIYNFSDKLFDGWLKIKTDSESCNIDKKLWPVKIKNGERLNIKATISSPNTKNSNIFCTLTATLQNEDVISSAYKAYIFFK